MKTAARSRFNNGRRAPARTRAAASVIARLIYVALALAMMPQAAWPCPPAANLTNGNPDKPDKPDETPDPVVLADGAATESATDVVLPGITGAWSHTRQYSSRLTSGAHIQGYGWLAGPLTTFVAPGSSYAVELYLNEVSKRVFTSTDQGQTYTAPDDFPATLERATEDNKHYFKLKYTHTRQTFYFCDFSNDWYTNEKGLLRWQKDGYGTEKISYLYDNNTLGGRITQVTTTQGWYVVYTYIQTGVNWGKISQIDVYDGSPSTGHVLQRVKYTYFDGSEYVHSDCGSDGDLILVEVLRRATKDNLANSTDNDFSIKRTTHYRYYRSGDANGGAHQLKAAYSPAAVTAVGGPPGNILAQADSSMTPGYGRTVLDCANVVYTYYTGTFDTTDVDASEGGVGGDNEDIQTKYGGAARDETGFVRSQKIQKDCRGLLGKRTFFYMENTGGNGLENAVKWIVVEDTTVDETNHTGTRKIYGLSDDRLLLREVFVDNPQAGTPKYWCQSWVLGTTKDQNANDVNSVIEKRLPSVHACINTTGKVTTFLDADEAADWNNTNIMYDSAGAVYTYSYDAECHVVEGKVKNGRTGSEYWLKLTVYGDGTANKPKYLPVEVYEYPVSTTSKAPDPDTRLKTSYTYTFHDADTVAERLKTRETSHPTVGTSENGSGVAVVTKEYYDDRGRLRWSQNGEKRVHYYAHHPDTGGLAYTMVDVKTDDLPQDITNGSSGKWLAWSGDAPFSYTSSDALKFVTKWEFDGQGRQVKVEDPEGMVTCTAYRNDGKRVYPGWNSTGPTVALPIRAEKVNNDELTTDLYTVDASDLTGIGVSGGLPTGEDTGETSSDYLTWTYYKYHYKTALLQQVYRYHDAAGGKFYRTVYRYDVIGRRTHVIDVVTSWAAGMQGYPTTSAVEQVTKTTYDALGRMSYVERGVSGTGHDMGSDSLNDGMEPYTSDPTFKQVAAYFYDEGTPGSGTSGVGDGLVTSRLEYYDAANIDEDHAVKTRLYHDWRGRLRGIRPTAAPYTVQDVDNLGRVTAVARYQGDLTWTGTGGSEVVNDDDYAQIRTTDATTNNKRGTLERSYHDPMGRVYKTEVYAVDSSDGTTTGRVETKNYYNRNSRLAATVTSGGPAAEFACDGAGRQIETRTVKELEATKYDANTGAFQYRAPEPKAAFGDLSGGDDGVIRLVHSTYDKVGNLTEQFTLEANHDNAGADGLDATNHDDYVQTAAYSWYDAQHRLSAAAAYGTNASIWKYATKPDRLANPPDRSDTVLVTSYEYEKGRLKTVTDPKGIVAKYVFDSLGCRLRLLENYVTGNPAADQNRSTLWEYDGLGNVTKQTADLDKDGTVDATDQATVYTYYDATRSPYRADLLTRTQYPDNTSLSADDSVDMEYDLDGRVHKRTSQKLAGENNRTEITFEYDGDFRRLTKQKVTQAAGADTTVQSIKTTYAAGFGRIGKVSSYGTSDCSGTALNEVQFAYNGFGALDKEYQEHNGAVDTGSSRYVQYNYDATLSSSVYTKGMRLKSVRYPNERLVHFTYGADDGLNDRLSRLAAIKEDNAGNPGNALAEYDWNGRGRLAKETFKHGGSEVINLDYLGGAAGKYRRLDRFGRVAWQTWTTAGGTARDRYLYGYDRNSNRLWRGERSGFLDAGRNEAYVYDGLNRLVRAMRGHLVAVQSSDPYCPIPGDCWGPDIPSGKVDDNDVTIFNLNYGAESGAAWTDGDFTDDGAVDDNDATLLGLYYGDTNRTVARAWEWTLDAPGNWSEYKVDGDGDGNFTDAGDLDQDRQHNLANEIDTDNDHSNGPADGAVTEQSNPQQTAWLSPKYEARGNLVQGPRPGDEGTTAKRQFYTYDAWNRLVKVVEDTDDDGTEDATDTVLGEYRYDGLGRRIRKFSDKTSGENPTWTVREYYYNAAWQVLEVRKEAGKGRTGSPPAEPTLAANVYEQFVWSARYIDAPVLRDRDSDSDGVAGDGDLGKSGSGLDERLFYLTDANMNVTALVNTSGAVVERYRYEPYGQVTILDGATGGQTDWATDADQKSDVDNEILFAGYRFDPESGLYHVRNRVYHCTLGRWLQRDPLGYVEGTSLYEYCGGRPCVAIDPAGLQGDDLLYRPGPEGLRESDLVYWYDGNQGDIALLQAEWALAPTPAGWAAIGAGATAAITYAAIQDARRAARTAQEHWELDVLQRALEAASRDGMPLNRQTMYLYLHPQYWPLVLAFLRGYPPGTTPWDHGSGYDTSNPEQPPPGKIPKRFRKFIWPGLAAMAGWLWAIIQGNRDSETPSEEPPQPHEASGPGTPPSQPGKPPTLGPQPGGGGNPPNQGNRHVPSAPPKTHKPKPRKDSSQVTVPPDPDKLDPQN